LLTEATFGGGAAVSVRHVDFATVRRTLLLSERLFHASTVSLRLLHVLTLLLQQLLLPGNQSHTQNSITDPNNSPGTNGKGKGAYT